jgi:hypothetical protein
MSVLAELIVMHQKDVDLFLETHNFGKRIGKLL